jgi:hypothetical protein
LTRCALQLPRLSGHPQPRKEAATRNRVPLRISWALATAFLLASSSAGATDLKPEAAQGFERYIHFTEQGMKAELQAGDAFLWVDRLPEPRRSGAYARLQKGEDIFERLRTAAPSSEISTPGAMIHHWVGTIFIPGVTMQQVLAVVQNYDHHAEYYAPDVARSKTVEHNGGDFKIFYRLRKKKVLTVTLDTDFDVRYHTLGSDHTYADSFSTRIAQVENPGEENERELPPGKDGGFLWRLNSYWRYFDTGRGVYMQCEAISLTRDIPAGLGWLIGPMIERLPKESLEFTLQSTRTAVLREAARATH